jgi:hypothetical protein
LSPRTRIGSIKNTKKEIRRRRRRRSTRNVNTVIKIKIEVKTKTRRRRRIEVDIMILVLTIPKNTTIRLELTSLQLLLEHDVAHKIVVKFID